MHDKPDYAEAYYTMGSVYKQMNKLPEAAEALRTALRLQPDFAGAHTTLAGVLRQMGDCSRCDGGKPGRRRMVAQEDEPTGRAVCYQFRETFAGCR